MEHTFGADEFLSPDDPSEYMTEEEASKGLTGAGARNVASFTAFNTVDPIETYRKVNEELSAGLRDTQESIRSEILLERNRQNTEVLSEIIADPTVSDDEKLSVATTIQRENEDFNLRTVTMSRALSKPNGTETVEQEERRTNFAEAIEEANRHAEFKQQALNSVAGSMSFEGLAAGSMLVATLGLPFIKEWASADVAQRFAEEGFIDPADVSSFWLFAGENRVAVRDALKKMPLNEREKVITSLLTLIQEESSIMYSDPNQAIMLDEARTLLEDGFYPESQRFMDNVFPVLDTLFLGVATTVRRGTSTLLGFAKAKARSGFSSVQLMARSRRNSVKGAAQPASPAEAIREVNPDTTRSIHVAIASDETGEVARATKGASRDDSLIDDTMPDVLDDDGVTRNFPSDVDAVQRDVEHSLSMSGRTEMSDVEKANARDNFLHKFTRPKFLNYRAAQSQIGTTADGGDFRMSVVFGETGDAGFHDLDTAVQAAVDQANRFGLSSDSIKLQARTRTGEYVDIDKDVAIEALDGAEGDFLVKFDFDYNVSPLDITRYEEAEINTKLFGFINPDRWFPQAGGVLTRWLKDAQSIFDKRIGGSGLAVEDRSSRLQKLLLQDVSNVETRIKSLDLGEQEKLHQHVVHANREGLKFNATELKAEGFSDAGVEAVQSFRQFWDRDWRLNNAAKRNQLKGEGVVVLEDTKLGTKLYGVEDASFLRNIGNRKIKVYDMDTDGYMDIAADTNLDEFFGGGRMPYKLHEPLNIDGTEVKWVVGNERSHVRPMNEADNIIPYREGYYKVGYTDSFFLERRVTDEYGEVTAKAIHSSDSASGIIQAAKRMNSEEIEDGVEYVARNDIKDVNDVRRMQDQAQGVSDGFRQHHRGERLGDAARPITDAEVDNPIDAMVRSAGSVARRISYSNWLQTTKGRFMQQYGSVIEPQGGKTIFPTHPKFINTSDLTKKRLSDEARTTWEYINHMENVRMNYGAALWKYGLKSAEEVFGESAAKGSLVGKVGEKTAKGLQVVKPADWSKRIAFEAAVVFNPMRQIFLGAFDVLTKGPMHGLNFAKGLKDAPAMVAANMAIGSKSPEARAQWMKIATGMSGRTEKDISLMLENFHQSGLVAAIDKQAMMSAGLHTEVERASVKNGLSGPVARGAENAYEKLRGIPYKGFEYNEYMTQGIVWASRYNQELTRVNKLGRAKLNKTELEDITSHVRSLNYGQNRAGELAYNSSALGVLFQFIQIPHKALMLIAPQSIGGSKMLTKGQKIKLTGTALALYGTPDDFFGVDVTGGITANIEDEQLRNTLRHGLVWNAFFNSFDASVSTRELSPFDAEAILDKFVSIYNGTPFADSPAAQFAWPRVTEAMRHTTGVWGVGFEDYDTPERFGSVVSKWASISSGYSNYLKGAYAMKHEEFISSKGWLSDPEVTGSEAMLKVWGVRTLAEQEIFETQQNIKKLRRAALDDVRMWFTDYKQSRIALGDDIREAEFMNRAYAEMWRVYKDTEAFKPMQEELRRLLKMDSQQGETKFMRDMLRAVEIVGPDDLKGMFNISGLSQDEIKDGHKFVDDINTINLYLEEE